MKNTILTYLEKIGKKNEIDLFINRYNKLPYDRFAVIKINSDTLQHQLDTFAQNIAYFNKMDMYPCIVFDQGDYSNHRSQNDNALNQTQLNQPNLIENSEDIIALSGNQLQNDIVKHGGNARLIMMTNFDGNESFNRLIAQIKELLSKRITPIIGCSYKTMNNNQQLISDQLFKKIAGSLKTIKMIYINEKGGILNSQDHVIPFLNLHSVEDMNAISDNARSWLGNIKEFINEHQDTEVVITSSQNILKEIFTIKGCGTYIKHYVIKSTTRPVKVDFDKSKSLLESVFKKKLIADYFDDPIEEIFYQKNWEAIAIIKKMAAVFYLCKFAVTPFRAGTGLGKAIWNHFIRQYPNLIWRSKPENKINSFYVAQCSGMVKKTKWNIYWKDIDDEKAFPLIKKVLSLKESFFDE